MDVLINQTTPGPTTNQFVALRSTIKVTICPDNILSGEQLFLKKTPIPTYPKQLLIQDKGDLAVWKLILHCEVS